MRFFPLCISILCFIFLSGSSTPISADDSDDIQPFTHEQHFEMDPEPIELGVVGNPLDYAGKRIGIDVRNFELPRGHEGRYRFACRFPIIDYVSNNPLYMKQWVEDVSGEIIRLQSEEYGMIIPLSTLHVMTDTYGLSDVSANSAIAISDTQRMFKSYLANSNFTKKYQDILKEFIIDFLLAKMYAKSSMAKLSDEDREFFKKNMGYFILPDGEKMPSVTGTVDSHFNFIERSRKVVYKDIFKAAQLVESAIQIYVHETKEFKPVDYFKDVNKSEYSKKINFPPTSIVISGFGDDTHNEDVDLIIDLGGNDKYSNNAGGCSTYDTGVAICIDHSGNDIYSNPERSYIQGFGFLGVGALVDLGGDDIYEANHFAQGAGIMGVGILYDSSGDDTYNANAFCQGAGMFGLGMLLDDKGEDFYDCATLGQGAATTLGMGILSDLEGDDRYHLNIGPGKDNLGSAGYGQGGALSFRAYPWQKELTAYGGVGMLIDGAGNDRYRTGGWCDQGGSYIMSLGALVDFSGNDHYTSNTGTGSGIHITNAILIDKDGHDIYDGGFRSGGTGGDRTPAFLIDYKGNDIYNARRACFGSGCKPFCLSIHLDYEGDDTYISPNPKDVITMNNWDSVGGVWPESAPYLWPSAMSLDLGGNDDYQIRNRKNNSERHSFGHGIHIDMEYSGGDVFGEIQNPLPPYEELKELTSFVKTRDIELLNNPDVFTRFQAVGRIVNSGPKEIPKLVERLVDSDHRQFNRDVMECLNYFFHREQITETETPHLIKLLKAIDPEVRTIIADDFGIWKIDGTTDALIETIKTDQNESVRLFALSSLLSLEAKKAVPTARHIVVNDPSENVRRVAVRFLTDMDNQIDKYEFFESILKNDPASTVKVVAAEGLGHIQDKRGIEVLRDTANSYDVYLQRAAGNALCQLYQIDGIDILIESLSFPSIDAFYNYARNVPNSIASYTGHDFVGDERYSQEKWREWFKENKDKIDLKKNVDSFRAYTKISKSLTDVSEIDAIEQLENFLKDYSDFKKAKIDLAGKLNSVAWNMVTAPDDSKDHNPEQGLIYALRAVELTEDPNYIDTLTEAYMANGQIDEAIKICQDMINQGKNVGMFTKRLARCEKILADS